MNSGSKRISVVPQAPAGAEITSEQRAALSALLAISEKRLHDSMGHRPHMSNVGFGGQGDGGSCTVGGGDTSDTTDSTYLLDPLIDSSNIPTDSSTDVVVEVVTSTITDWAPIDSVYDTGSGDGTGGDGTGGDGTGGGDDWGDYWGEY